MWRKINEMKPQKETAREEKNKTKLQNIWKTINKMQQSLLTCQQWLYMWSE